MLQLCSFDVMGDQSGKLKVILYCKSFVKCYGSTNASKRNRNDSLVMVSDYTICATPRHEIVPNTGAIASEFLSLEVNPGN